MTDVWVVNASPLIILGQAGKLELLEKLCSELVVPNAVAEEILAGPDDPARRALVSGWSQRREATVPEQVAEWGLGKGESAVIALALSLGATAVVDDRNARRCAQTLGVSCDRNPRCDHPGKAAWPDQRGRPDHPVGARCRTILRR